MLAHKQISSFVAAIFLAAAFLIACQPAASTVPAPPLSEATVTAEITEEPSPTPEPTIDPAAPVDIRIASDRTPATWDPVLVTSRDVTGSDLVDALFIGLTRIDPSTGTIIPMLAREWRTVDEDGFVWHVFLRDDIHWVRINEETNEQEIIRQVAAADVVAAVRRACTSSQTGATVRPLLSIRGCADLARLPDDAVTEADIEQRLGARVLNDVALEFTLTEENSTFPSLMAMPAMRPVPFEVVDANDMEWTEPSRIWTSGPFILSPESSTENGYILQANQDWPLERGNVAEVTIDILPADEAYTSWQNEALLLSPVPVDRQMDEGVELRSCSISTFGVFAYETTPFTIAEVRRAFSTSINREEIAQTLRFDETGCTAGVPAASLSTPASIAHPAEYQYLLEPHPDFARSQMAEAGYGACSNVPPITLLTDGSNAALAETLATTWESELSCVDRFTVDVVPLNDVLLTIRRQPELREQPRPGIMLMNWQADLHDAYHWYADVMGCQTHFGSYINPGRACAQADDTLLASLGEMQPEQRENMMQQIAMGFFGEEGDMPVIPIAYWARPLITQAYVTLPAHADGPLQFDLWQIDASQLPEGPR